MTAAGQVQSRKQDPLAFSKMSGGGNDFVVVDNRQGRIEDGGALARRVCTRALSVGADGLILLEPSLSASFRMRYWNADGSLGEFCGNGTRCIARFAFVNGVAGRSMTIETDAGVVTADVDAHGTVSISLPRPRFFQSRRPLAIGPTTINGSFLNVGVPHYVVLLDDDLWSRDIVPLGRAIRTHPELQPDGGANANFVRVLGRNEIEVRTYERGVENETLACGSGITASVFTAAMFAMVESPVSVLTRSGITLEVSYIMSGGSPDDLRLSGDARLVYHATTTPETLDGFDPEFVRDPANHHPEPKVLSAE